MAEFNRVVTFDADDAAIDAMVKEISSADGRPPGVNAKRITVLADRAAGQVKIVVRFPSAEALEEGAKVFEAMNPPDDGSFKRVSVEVLEVLLERDS